MCTKKTLKSKLVYCCNYSYTIYTTLYIMWYSCCVVLWMKLKSIWTNEWMTIIIFGFVLSESLCLLYREIISCTFAFLSKTLGIHRHACQPAYQPATIPCYIFPRAERDVISCTNPIVILINLYRVYIANYIVSHSQKYLWVFNNLWIVNAIQDDILWEWQQTIQINHHYCTYDGLLFATSPEAFM